MVFFSSNIRLVTIQRTLFDVRMGKCIVDDKSGTSELDPGEERAIRVNDYGIIAGCNAADYRAGLLVEPLNASYI